MPDDSMGPVTDDLVARLYAACAGHPFAKIEWPHRILHEAAERITTLERELEEAQTLRHKAEFHAGVLEAQNGWGKRR